MHFTEHKVRGGSAQGEETKCSFISKMDSYLTSSKQCLEKHVQTGLHPVVWQSILIPSSTMFICLRTHTYVLYIYNFVSVDVA